MGFVRLGLFVVGFLLVIAAAWVFLTQTSFAEDVDPSVALAIILLLVGLGVMVSANAVDDTIYRRRTFDADYGPPPTTRAYRETYREERPSGGESYVEERRF